MDNGRMYKNGITGWVACDYTDGDYINDVCHSDVYEDCDTASQWNKSWREVYGESYSYAGIRWVGPDGYLYVDEQIEE